jgi:hypothetical protein
MVFEKFDPKPHTQGQMFALGKHGVNTVGLCRKRLENGNELPVRNFSLYLPRAAPGDAITGQTP